MLSYEVEAGLRLQLLKMTDAPELFALVDTNRDFLRTWLPWVDMNTDVNHSRDFIMASRLQFADRSGMPLGIIVDGKIAGTIGCNTINWGTGSAEIGYWLGQQFTGRGIITKCTKALVSYLIAEGINRIVIRAADNNSPSRAVPERLGFTQEGIMRQAAMQNGKHINLVLYSLLAEEWSAS